MANLFANGFATKIFGLVLLLLYVAVLFITRVSSLDYVIGLADYYRPGFFLSTMIALYVLYRLLILFRNRTSPEAVVAEIRARLESDAEGYTTLHKQGYTLCAALHTLLYVCGGTDNAAPAKRQRAADAGALEAVVAAMKAHRQTELVQQVGCGALANICYGTDSGVSARVQRALDAGALEAAVAAMKAQPRAEAVQEKGCLVVTNLCVSSLVEKFDIEPFSDFLAKPLF